MITRAINTPSAVITLLIGLSLLLTLWPQHAHAGGDSQQTVVVEDSQYGEVLFYFYQEDYFPAIVRLLAAKKQEQFVNHSDEAELLLGGLYLSYGQISLAVLQRSSDKLDGLTAAR